jgi:septation ring formation regulator EzrA
MGKVRYITDEEVSKLNKMIAEIMEEKQVENEEMKSSLILVTDSYELSEKEEEEELHWERATKAMEDVWDEVCRMIDRQTRAFGKDLLDTKFEEGVIEVWRC